MFEFACGVGLGVDVADFLELERAFQRNGVVQAPAQEECVFHARKVFGPADELRLQRQHGLQGHGQVAHGFEVLGLLRFGEAPLALGQCQCQQEQASELGGKGLGTGHTNFHAGAGDVRELAFAHHGAGGHVADGECVLHAQGLRVAQRGQGVGGFAALADGDDQGARVGHAGAVAVFAGHFHLGGNARDVFQPVLGGAAAVVAGAAGQDEDVVDFLENAPRGSTGLAVQAGAVKQFRHDAFHAFERVGNGARLLEDFLLHVVAVRAQLGRAAVGQHSAHRALGRRQRLARGRTLGHDPVAAQLQVHQVPLFQIDDLVGHARQGHGVAGQEVLGAVFAHAQDERRACACAHHAVGFVLVDDGDGVGAVQLGHSGLHRFKQVALVEAVYQVGDDLGIRLAHKHIATGLQGGAQFFVVFDDAVVHQRHTAWLAGGIARAMAEMRVGVVHGRCTVRGPAGVGDAGGAVQVLGGHLFQQFGHAGGAAGALQAALGRAVARRIKAGGVHCHTARVIAAVFEPLQALHKDGNDVARGYRADDAAHGWCLR